MIPSGSATVYNKYIDTSLSEQYLGTIIPQVVWWGPRGVRITRQGLIAANTWNVMIPQGMLANFLDFQAWQALPILSKPTKWTLQEGDWMVYGSVSDVIIPGTFSITQLKAKYPEVGQVISVDPMDQGNMNMRFTRVWLK